MHQRTGSAVESNSLKINIPILDWIILNRNSFWQQFNLAVYSQKTIERHQKAGIAKEYARGWTSETQH